MKCYKCGTEYKGKYCPNCGAQSPLGSDVQQSYVKKNKNTKKSKNSILKKWWFWVLVIVVLGAIGYFGDYIDKLADGSSNSNISSTDTDIQKDDALKSDTTVNEGPQITVADFSEMDQASIQSWADTNNVVCKFSEDYSDSIANGCVISQSKNAGETVKDGTTIEVVISRGKKPPTEYLNALAKAESYSKIMCMSKKRIYDQLTSQYGEKFPADAAQYAIDNMTVDWNANALQTAKTYQKTMNMSKSAIYDQLISEYGEQFTKAEAQYAIDNLDD